MQPLVRASNGVLQPVNWHDAWRALREPVATAKDGFHILVSAHASLEELHLVKQLAGRIGAPISVSYTVTEKRQPVGVKFKVPAANAPNVNGARDLGLRVPADNATVLLGVVTIVFALLHASGDPATPAAQTTVFAEMRSSPSDTPSVSTFVTILPTQVVTPSRSSWSCAFSERSGG